MNALQIFEYGLFLFVSDKAKNLKRAITISFFYEKHFMDR